MAQCLEDWRNFSCLKAQKFFHQEIVARIFVRFKGPFSWNGILIFFFFFAEFQFIELP